MWLQTGSCSAAIRGICSKAHSLNELSQVRPSPHRSYFNVSCLGTIETSLNPLTFQEAPSPNNSYRIGMGPISSRQSPFVAGPSPNVKKPLKMVMCVNFNNSGHCDRGETCTYAHGLSELHEYRMKQVKIHPSFALLWLLSFDLMIRFLTIGPPCVRPGALRDPAATETLACTPMATTSSGSRIQPLTWLSWGSRVQTASGSASELAPALSWCWWQETYRCLVI